LATKVDDVPLRSLIDGGPIAGEQFESDIPRTVIERGSVTINVASFNFVDIYLLASVFMLLDDVTGASYFSCGRARCIAHSPHFPAGLNFKVISREISDYFFLRIAHARVLYAPANMKTRWLAGFEKKILKCIADYHT